MPASKKAVVKKGVTDVAAIREQLKKNALAMKDRVSAPQGNKIKIKTNKTFNFPDGRIEEGPIELVVVDFINRQIFYENGYVEGEVEQPTCWAINKIIKDLKPSDEVENPEGESCTSCPMNVWGTDGKGKACKMNRKLVVVDPYDEEPELMTLEINKKGAENFDGFASSVFSKYEMEPIAVIARFAFTKKEDYPLVTVTDAGLNENLGLHFPLQKQAQPILEAGFQPVEQTEQPVQKKKPVRKKRAVRKKT